MKRGPKPKPQPVFTTAATISTEAPQPPGWLPEGARDIYNEVSAELAKNGHLRKTDGHLVENYAVTAFRLSAISRELSTQPLCRKGRRGALVVSPLFRMETRLAARLLAAAQILGIGPLSRKRLGVTNQTETEEEDPTAKYMSDAPKFSDFVRLPGQSAG